MTVCNWVTGEIKKFIEIFFTQFMFIDFDTLNFRLFSKSPFVKIKKVQNIISCFKENVQKLNLQTDWLIALAMDTNISEMFYIKSWINFFGGTFLFCEFIQMTQSRESRKKRFVKYSKDLYKSQWGKCMSYASELVEGVMFFVVFVFYFRRKPRKEKEIINKMENAMRKKVAKDLAIRMNAIN